MGQRGIAHRLKSSVIYNPSRSVGIATVALLAQLGAAPPVWGAVVLSAGRTELLYSSNTNPDCGKFSKVTDDTQLPLNVTRIHAAVDGAPADQIRYQWSMPKDGQGILAADLDLPADKSAAIAGLCAEFGNVCVLTPDKLPFYNFPTILLLAPGCSVLPTDTSKRFRGDIMDVRLRATVGKRKLGKGSIKIGFGRTAFVTLFAAANGRPATDGIGSRRPIPSDINPHYAATVDAQGQTLPKIDTFTFDSGGGLSAAVMPTSCALDSSGATFDACVVDFLYKSAGNVTPSVKVDLDDGSALCDNISVRILSAINVIRLNVKVSPRRSAYASDSSVNLRVSATNISDPTTGSNILLTGGGVLNCVESLAIGGNKDSKTTIFDLQHCLTDSTQPCGSDIDCAAGDKCATQSHCSAHTDQTCAHDSDCDPKTCASCDPNESCVQVLATPQVTIPIGRTVVLIDKPVSVRNAFPDKAKMKDHWTITPFNADPDDITVQYGIRGHPGP
jgi:hypothetical protein